MAKRFVVVGLGIFGDGIARALYDEGHDVIAVDLNEERVSDIARHVSRAAVGDARQTDVLEKIGAGDADAAVVSTGDDIGASILVVMALRDLGVPQVYVKVISSDHGRILKKIGVTEIVFPEHESSRNLAQRITHSESLLNYVKLGENFSMQEMAVPNRWRGKTLRELQLRPKYNVSVIAVHDVLTDTMYPVPDPDARLKDSDTLLVTGTTENLARIANIQ